VTAESAEKPAESAATSDTDMPSPEETVTAEPETEEDRGSA
jgi:hypothetical protein